MIARARTHGHDIFEAVHADRITGRIDPPAR
jgi:hypothetical protein